MKSYEAHQKELSGIIDLFKKGEVPDAMAFSMIDVPENIPVAKWKGYHNRIMLYLFAMRLGKSMDCRTFKQWKAAKRFPEKGSKGIPLYRPIYARKKTVDEKTGDEEVKQFVNGFGVFYVFSYDDTKGEPIPELPDIATDPPPLFDIARHWDVKVEYQFKTGSFGGFFNESRNKIVLCSEEESIFFHELGHAAHGRVLKSRGETFKPYQDAKEEAVADLTAATLSLTVGKRSTVANTFQYVEAYAKSIGKTVPEICEVVLDDVDACLREITTAKEELTK